MNVNDDKDGIHQTESAIKVNAQVSSRQEGRQDREAQIYKESTMYKYIPRHFHIIPFEQVEFCKQKG